MIDFDTFMQEYIWENPNDPTTCELGGYGVKRMPVYIQHWLPGQAVRGCLNSFYKFAEKNQDALVIVIASDRRLTPARLIEPGQPPSHYPSLRKYAGEDVEACAWYTMIIGAIEEMKQWQTHHNKPFQKFTDGMIFIVSVRPDQHEHRGT